jgi:hypothetical protein
MRYIICSDMHGNLSRLTAIIKHSEFDPTKDKLIHAGDCCDIGPQTYDVMQEVLDLGGILMPGNHEIGHLFRHRIMPYDSTLDVGDFCTRWNDLIKSRKSPFVLDIEGYIITHAGISEWTYNKYGPDVYDLNEEMYEAYMHGNSFDSLFYDDFMSPLWYRPYYSSILQVVKPAPGLKQFCGHTPAHSLPQDAIFDSNLFLIDGFNENGSVKYGVIDNGVASVVCFQPDVPIIMYKMRTRIDI